MIGEAAPSLPAPPGPWIFDGLMMAMFKNWLSLALLLAISTSVADAAALPGWVAHGERLSYKVYLWGFAAGGAEFYYAPGRGPQQHEYRIIARLWTAGGMARLFRVRDRVQVEGEQDLAAHRLFLTRRFHQRLHEGHYRANRTVTYDRRRDAATFVNRRAPASKPETAKLLAGMRDMFSALYYLRATVGDAQVGRSFTVPIHDLTRSYRLKVEVVRRERLNTALGPVQTLLVRPQAQALEPHGAADADRSRLRIWVTDDQRRLPVRLQMALSVGSFTADLTSAGPADSPSHAPSDLPAVGPVGAPPQASRPPADGS